MTPPAPDTPDEHGPHVTPAPGLRRFPLPPDAVGLHGEAHSSADTPKNRLAAQLRRLGDFVVGRPLDDGALDVAARSAAAVADDLEAAAAAGKAPRGLPLSAGHPQDFFATSPVIGYANPIALPVDVWAVEGEGGLLELRGQACYGYAYEGPPTCVHGGVLAALFDEMLGSVNILVGRAGLTGTLTVRYRRPTPLLARLDLVARQTGTEGRKIFAWGAVYHEGELTAEAEGIFVELEPNRMLGIVDAHAKEAADEVVDAQLRRFVEAGGELRGVEGPPPT